MNSGCYIYIFQTNRLCIGLQFSLIPAINYFNHPHIKGSRTGKRNEQAQKGCFPNTIDLFSTHGQYLLLWENGDSIYATYRIVLDEFIHDFAASNLWIYIKWLLYFVLYKKSSVNGNDFLNRSGGKFFYFFAGIRTWVLRTKTQSLTTKLKSLSMGSSWQRLGDSYFISSFVIVH